MFLVAERQLILARLFKAGGRLHRLFSRGATVDYHRQTQSSLRDCYECTFIVPALKSRAELSRSLRDREGGGCIYYSNAISAGLHSDAAAAASRLSSYGWLVSKNDFRQIAE
jgi:hypothetical protein